MGARFERVKRALYVARVARRGRLLRVLRELGVVGGRPATREGALEFREALEQLGTTYIKLGQLLSSRPDLLPDVYIEELGKLVDDVPAVPFAEIRQVIEDDLPADAGPEAFSSGSPLFSFCSQPGGTFGCRDLAGRTPGTRGGPRAG